VREILFRGKRKDNNGKWIYGGLLDHWVGSGEELYFVTKSVFPPFVEMIPETIGQYTGVKDKSGRKIFEGDVVRIVVVYSDCDVIYTGAIRYERGSFWFSGESASGNGYTTCCWHHVSDSDIEIIGNVHDDPELLKGGGNGAD
jgi:uncharacterized phage protein (TIGR01671 family)